MTEPDLRRIDITKLKPGHELVVRVLATSTGRHRLRAAIVVDKHDGKPPVEVELFDKVMALDAAVLEVHAFAANNLATVANTRLDAGAGRTL